MNPTSLPMSRIIFILEFKLKLKTQSETEHNRSHSCMNARSSPPTMYQWCSVSEQGGYHSPVLARVPQHGAPPPGTWVTLPGTGYLSHLGLGYPTWNWGPPARDWGTPTWDWAPPAWDWGTPIRELGPVTGVPLGKDLGPLEVLWDGDGVPSPGEDRQTPAKTVPSPSFECGR